MGLELLRAVFGTRRMPSVPIESRSLRTLDGTEAGVLLETWYSWDVRFVIGLRWKALRDPLPGLCSEHGVSGEP